MTDDPKLQMARRAAASAYQNAHDYDYALWVMHGLKDDTIGVKIALAAIEECTERAAKLAESSDGYNDVSGTKIARLLRSGDHLKGPTDPIIAGIADDIANGRTESQQP